MSDKNRRHHRLSSLSGMRVLGCLVLLFLLPRDAKAESYWEYASRMASEAKAYAETKAGEAYRWASSEAEYVVDTAVEAASSTYDAAASAASTAYTQVVSAAAPYTQAKPAPRPTPKPSPDVTTGCAGDPLPSEGETAHAMTILEVVKMAGNVDCAAVARVQGFATSLRPLQIPQSSLDLTPVSSTQFRACKVPSGMLEAAWSGVSTPFRCLGNGGYGLFVDGAWGDADFLVSLAGMALKEGGRAVVGSIPIVGDDILHSAGMSTYQELGAEAAEAAIATVDKASQYLGTPEGRQKLEVMLCYGMNPGFKMAADVKMFNGMNQMLVNGLPGAAEKLAETPCEELASLGCRLGGMIGYEFVSDALFEAAAVAATATGVGAAAGAAIGAGAIAKTLGKIAVKSAEAAVELFRFMMKLIPADLLKDVVKGLEKLLPGDLYALIRKASGLSDEGAEVASTAAKSSSASAAATARKTEGVVVAEKGAARSTSGTPALPPSRVSPDSTPPSGLRTSSMREVPDSAPTVTVRDSRDWRPEGPPPRTAGARAAAAESYSKAAEELLVADTSWVSDPRRLRYNQELLIERAAAHLDANGVPYRIVSEGSHQWIEIIPEKGAGNQLSRLAVGLNRSGSTSLVYDPVYLAQTGATAAYSQGSARLYMDTAAFLNLDSTGTALAHELTHYKTARSAARGVEDPFPGNFTAADGSSLASRKGEPYGEFMSSDEVSAMAHQLRRETDLEEARIVAYGGDLLSTRTADRADDVVRYLEDPVKAAERRQIPLEFADGPNAPRGPTAVMTVDSGKGQVFETRMPLAGGRSKAELDAQVAREIGRDLAALELAPPGKAMSGAQEQLYESVLAEVKNGSAAIDYRMDANSGRVTAWVTPSKGGAPISVDLGGTEGAGLKRQYQALADRSRQQARIFEMNQEYIQMARKAATPEEVRAAEAARSVVNRKRPLPGDPGYDPAALAAVEREAREAYERALRTPSGP